MQSSLNGSGNGSGDSGNGSGDSGNLSTHSIGEEEEFESESESDSEREVHHHRHHSALGHAVAVGSRSGEVDRNQARQHATNPSSFVTDEERRDAAIARQLQEAEIRLAADGGSPTAHSSSRNKGKKKKKRRRSSGKIYAVEEVVHFPLFIYTTVLLCLLITVYELYLNNLNRTEDNPCPIKLYSLCFESFKVNPFLGPSTEVLLDMGAKTGEKVVLEREWSRLFKCTYLHGGLVHLLFNMMALCQLGIGIEKSYGSAKVAMLYFTSGIFGSITSTIFSPDSVGVGASGAIFGLFGAAWGDLVQNWDLYDGPQWTLLSLTFGTLFNLGLGTAPILDNFAHFFGFWMGALVALGLLVVERQSSSGRHLTLQWWHYVLEFFPVILVPALIVTSLAVLFAGVGGHTICSWCGHINCIPFPWGCDIQEEGACMFDCNTCSSGGVLADAMVDEDTGGATNATVTLHCPILSDWTTDDTVDFVLPNQDVSDWGSLQKSTDYLIEVCKDHCPDAYL